MAFTTLTINLLYLVLSLLLVLVLCWKWSLTYWQRKGLNYIKPHPLYGNMKKLIFREYSFGEQMLDIYKELRARGVKHGGAYMGTKPIYIPIDPEIVKHILIKDFASFINRGIYVNTKADPFTGNLIFAEGEKWRNLRTYLTPTFTSGKMKMMFGTMRDCSHQLGVLLDNYSKSKEPVNINDILGRYTTDVIGTCAFGVTCNTLQKPDSEFRTYCNRVFQSKNLKEKLTFILPSFLPKALLRFVNYRIVKQDVEDFFMKVVEEVVHYREKNQVFRKDFMHLLIQLKNRGQISEDNKLTDEQNSGKGVLDMKQLAAQAFIFFMAGFETSSTTMTFVLLDLAQHMDIQDKLRKEINRVLTKHNNEPTYEAMMEMEYLEKVICESMRLNPPAPFVPRVCNTKYTVPGTNIVLDPGVKVEVSIWGLHTDPEYWPNPMEYDPERFSPEEKAERPPCTFLPFGEGPRTCLGVRFAMLQIKACLVEIIKNYTVTLHDATKLPFDTDKETFVHSIRDKIWLNVTRIN